MKTVVLIENEVGQIVLTPETEFERAAVQMLVQAAGGARDGAGGKFDFRQVEYSQTRGGFLREFERGNEGPSLILIPVPASKYATPPFSGDNPPGS